MRKALIVDDNEENLYFLDVLLKGNGFEVEFARNGNEALTLARANPPAIVVSDILMPVMDGFTLCRAWRSDPVVADIPFVFYTATYTHEKDEALALDLGADCFLLKPLEPEALIAAIAQVLERHAAGHLSRRQPAVTQPEVFLREYNGALIRKLEDKLVELEDSRRELTEAEAFVRAIVDSLPLHVVVLDSAGQILSVNRPCEQTEGLGCGPWLGQLRKGLNYLDVCRAALPADAADVLAAELHKLLRGDSRDFAHELECPAEHGTLWYSIHATPLRIRAGWAVLTHSDITRRREAEERHGTLERQLRQTQKLEMIGRLAGGVAHDFNNLLTVVNGYTDLLLKKVDARDPMHRQLAEIRKAGQRGASLTQQLLAFSRKQIIQPQILDLNHTVREAANMLRRLIGEDIELVTILSPDLGYVLADLGAIDQVLMNLAVNARDAMPDGGRLSIETRNVELGACDVQDHSEASPGQYVQLTVSDTGVGMDLETQAHLFEPFFTTKKNGEGTGLGLATVHGIVKQAGGIISVRSEPGRGATFQIQLPSLETTSTASEAADSAVQAIHGTETILLVEDQPELRELVRTLLQEFGYTVLASADAAEAIAHSERYTGTIDLLLTDVVMPGLSGLELAGRLQPLRPRMKLLYMSGYSNDLTPGGVIDASVAYIQKPVSAVDLGMKIREVLNLSR